MANNLNFLLSCTVDFYKVRAVGYIYGHNLKSEFDVQCISYYNDHVGITTVEVGSGVEAGQGDVINPISFEHCPVSTLWLQQNL